MCVDMLMCPVNPADINQIQGHMMMLDLYFFVCSLFSFAHTSGILSSEHAVFSPPSTGVYAVKPPFPAVGGGEGVGRVSKVGANVTSFAEGDWVVPATTTLGKAVPSHAHDDDMFLNTHCRNLAY